jgi:hypothetical protein
MISKLLLLAAAIIVVLGAAIYVPSLVQSPSSSSSLTTSTTATSCTTVSSTVSTTTTTSSSTDSNVTYGQFSYSPSSPVRIESVQAVTAPDSHGNTTVTFEVLFQNIGSAPVYVMGGCGGGLSASVVGASSVIQKVQGGPLCDCAAIILTLGQGQNHTSITPGCWSGYAFHLLSPGTVSVNMTLAWSTDGQSLGGSNSTSIQATFSFA